MPPLTYHLFLFFASFCLLTTNLSSQECSFANCSFEDWELIDSVSLPSNWSYGSNHNLGYKVNQSGQSTHGSSSLLMRGDTLNFSGPGCTLDLRGNFKLNDVLPANPFFTFDIKAIGTQDPNQIYFKLYAWFFKDGSSCTNVMYQTYDPIPIFTSKSFLLECEGIDSIKLWIEAGALDGPTDGCENKSKIWLDHFRFETSSATSASHVEKTKIYPNPTSGIIYLDGGKTYKHYKIYNTMGQELQTGNIQNNQITVQAGGLLLLVLIDNQGNTLSDSFYRSN